MQVDLRYELQSKTSLQVLLKEIKKHFAIKIDRKVSRVLTFYDTFDWRLYNKSLILQFGNDSVTLKNLNDTNSVASLVVPQMPTFVWDFPASAIKQKLETILEMRALLKIFEMKKTSTPIRILNADQKTVVRMFEEEITVSSPEPKTSSFRNLQLNAVRGYDQDAQRVAQILEDASVTGVTENRFLKALSVSGQKAGDYSAKLNFTLQPDMRADESAKVILRYLLKVIKQNEDGIRRDIDTEFLHDFRVAIRRTRSALGQIKNVFPNAITERFKKDFSFLGKSTNRLRDLDVYLLNADTYRRMLPDQLRSDIDPLFAKLRSQRKRAWQEVISLLDSLECEKILHDWQAFLNQPPAKKSQAFNATIPVIQLARKRIFKRYRDIVKSGSEITDASEDAALHRLRIDCKKLRYLLEFFSSLFEQEKIGFLTKQLKRLQDNLGLFQDLCVQEKELQNFIDSISLKNRGAKRSIAAIGSLIGTLDRQKQSVRAEFANIFSEFASETNSQLFQELFNNEANE